MAEQPFLSVVIPSYNEQKNLQRGVLEEVYAYLLDQNYTWELILTDDGSTDGTINSLQKFAEGKKNVTVLNNKHAGKGPTVSTGMLKATGKYRLFTDFDQSTPISEVTKALDVLQSGSAEIAIGSREVAGAARAKEPFHRHVMGRGFNLMVQILALRGISDSQCGFKLFTDNATTLLFPALVIYGSQKPRKDSYTGAFDVELLFLARKKGLKIVEIPVKWAHFSSDRVSPIKDSLRMFRDIVRIRLAWLTGQYSFS